MKSAMLGLSVNSVEISECRSRHFHLHVVERAGRNSFADQIS